MSPIRPTVQLVGLRLEPEHHRLRDFLTRTAQPHEWLEAGSPQATVLLERLGLAGEPLPMIENFFGFPDGIGGAELARMAGRQAEKFGAEIMVLRGIRSSRLNGSDDRVTLALDDGSEVKAAVVLAATGIEWRRLDLDGIDGLLGHGVYYGAGRARPPIARRAASSSSEQATRLGRR